MTPQVLGSLVDEQTRCIHYRTTLDVVAIKFHCCLEYYPCHQCHQEHADHDAATWPVEEQGAPAILCGVCREELTIRTYLDVTSCPNCRTPFNPGCRLHVHHYFEV
ncbi:CHY zinc finger protein [Nesterenkonia sphaerica]|uniref:CHY-type domain-containing protein n=1 Tax=Nesterenkonia sphaerica TaxID=1804988 RepID=A0A5R9ACH0_9MICC|nr:CHY zinc finger protein [Nesterenkonia sphaerica]TLP75547.1 hypothetical protein FEF27_07790 [Nesterenkonia sphaerica]